MRQHRAAGQNEVLSPATPSSGRLMSTIIDTFVAPPCREQITLLYQDEHLVLINKPAGLLSLSGKDPRNLDSVHHRLVQRFPGYAPGAPPGLRHLRPDGDRPQQGH